MNGEFQNIIDKKLGAYPIGAWVPYYKEELNAQTLKRIRECGINFVPTLSCEKEELELIEKAGLRALVSDERVTYANVSNISKIDEYVGEYADSSAVLGVFVWDEPSPTMMDVCGLINRQVQKNRPDCFGYVNLHPNYSDCASQRDGLTYAEYLDYFVEHCEPKMLSFDHYPFYYDGFHADEYFDNLAAIRTCCDKHGLDFWSFLQSSSFCKNPIPTENELRFQAHTNIAYGAKGLLYFTYRQVVHEDGFGYALVDKEKKITELYGYAQSINKQVEAVGKTLLKLTHKGVAFFGDKYINRSTVKPDFTLEGGNFVVGVFSCGTRKYAYVVNLSFSDSVTARLTHKGKTMEFELKASDGTLIEL